MGSRAVIFAQGPRDQKGPELGGFFVEGGGDGSTGSWSRASFA
jgi:hypothetical protein